MQFMYLMNSTKRFNFTRSAFELHFCKEDPIDFASTQSKNT
jgi:hypothetical protein